MRISQVLNKKCPGSFIHDGSNDKSLGPVSQGTGSPIFHTRGATGNWTPVGILENSYRSLHARSLRVACSHIGCTLQAPNLVGNNPSTFPGWFLRMFRVTPFMLTTRAWESTLVADFMIPFYMGILWYPVTCHLEF